MSVLRWVFAAGNHGLLMDAARRRIFIACEDNAMLFVLDRPAMHVEGRWSVGDGPSVELLARSCA